MITFCFYYFKNSVVTIYFWIEHYKNNKTYSMNKIGTNTYLYIVFNQFSKISTVVTYPRMTQKLEIILYRCWSEPLSMSIVPTRSNNNNTFSQKKKIKNFNLNPYILFQLSICSNRPASILEENMKLNKIYNTKY